MRDVSLSSNIWKFYLYKFLRGLWLPATIWTIYLLARGFSFTQIGITEMVIGIIIILLEVPSGAFADLVGRKYSVFSGYIVLGIAVFLIGWTGEFSTALIFFALYGIGQTLFSGADNALLYDSLLTLKREKEYAKIDGKAGAFFSVGSACGGFIGVWLYAKDISLPFFVGSAVFVLAGASFLLMKEPTLDTRKYSFKAHYAQMREGVAYAKGHAHVRWIIAYCAIILSLFGYQLFMMQPSVLQLGFSVKHLAFIYAAVWGLEAVLYWNAHRILERLGEKRTLFLITGVHACCFFALSAIHWQIGLVFIIINYFGRGLFYPVTNAFAQKHIVSSHRATVLSVQNFIMAIVESATLLLFGISTDVIGINTTYALVGVAITICAVGLYLTYPNDTSITS